MQHQPPWNVWPQDPQQYSGNYQYYSGMPTPVNWAPTYYHQFPTEQCTSASTLSSNNQKDTDQEWFNDWASKLNKCSVKTQNTSRSINIPDVKSLLKEALILLQDLTKVQGQLKDLVINGDESLWNFRSQRAQQIKKRLDEIQTTLSENSDDIENKLKSIKKKRVRIRKKNEVLKQEKKNSAETRQRLHTELNEWQNRMCERIKEVQREQELKKEADSILSEVRKKISESKKALELVTSLQKLRILKKQSAERKGLYTTKEADTTFTKTTNTMIEMLEMQLKDYQNEEKALCVMLDQEAEEKEAHDLQDKLSATQNSLVEFLFGKIDLPPPDDPLYPFTLFYTQAERDLNSFHKIRQEWDAYLDCTGKESSSVPVQWVTLDSITNN